jgi:hypothetical protein
MEDGVAYDASRTPTNPVTIVAMRPFGCDAVAVRG